MIQVKKIVTKHTGEIKSLDPNDYPKGTILLGTAANNPDYYPAQRFTNMDGEAIDLALPDQSGPDLTHSKQHAKGWSR